ncbi:MAG: T9SS type A sorting domain-containing protein, partial [Ignavibacteria bacterium]|nr:T9SS type A sorting domain-containing protein [Ignavibacteria bacterium]
TSNDQWMPWITVSPFGRVTIVFYDSRDDLIPPVNQATETWIAESVDGGVTFTNTRVSDVSFVPVPVPNTATGYMGDYIGITSKAGSAYPAWADNRTGVYQIFLDIHDTYMQDLGVIASQSRSSVRYATAYGSGPKVVYAGNRWHRLFHMNEHLAYAQSTDDGVTWTNASLVNGSAIGWLSNPSLYASGGLLHAVFRTDIQGVYYLRGTTAGVWESPRLVREVDGVINGIASVVDKNGICHVWYSYTRSGPSSNCYLAYGTFDTAEPDPVFVQSANLVVAPAPIERLSAVVDPVTGYPHVVWESGGEILYRYRVGNLWVPAVSVSETTTPSVSPGLATINGTLHLVWQEEIEGGSEIFYRSRTGGGSWSATSNLSNSPGESVEPTVTGPVNGGPLVVWSDDSGGIFDLHYAVPGGGASGVLGSTAVQSRHPVIGIRGIRTGTRAVVLCTDGLSSLYEVVTARKDFAHASATMMPQQFTSGETVWNGLTLSNTPNPFNPVTTIHYQVPTAGIVSLKVFDLVGQEVATLVDGFRDRGAFTAVFEGTDLPSGVYLYRLQHGRESRVGRMILMK